MKRSLQRTLVFTLTAITSALGFAGTVFAGDPFLPMVPIPGIDYGNIDGEQYLRTLYILAISFAALLAVAQLVIAGFQYITSEIVTDKEDAKRRIRAAIIGLLIILAAVALLRAINPAIANLPALQPPPRVDFDRPRAEPVNDDIDALDIAQAREACEAKASEGYVFKVHSGNWSDPIQGVECCIPDGTGANACRGDTSDEIGGVTIDTSTPYTRSEYDQLLQDIRDSGATVTDAPILLMNIDREKRTCSAQGGTPYVVQRDRGLAYTTPQQMLLCVYNDPTNSNTQSADPGTSDIQPPSGMPPDAEAIMVDGQLYYVSGVQDDDPDTTALYCEPGNTACNDYCDTNGGVVDMQSGICYMEPQVLELDVSG